MQSGGPVLFPVDARGSKVLESMVSHCNQPRDAGDVEHEHQQ